MDSIQERHIQDMVGPISISWAVSFASGLHDPWVHLIVHTTFEDLETKAVI